MTTNALTKFESIELQSDTVRAAAPAASPVRDGSLQQSDLVLLDPGPLDQHPAAVYLASLASAAGRRSQQHNLKVIAGILTGGAANELSLNWCKLRYQHTAALRTRLLQRYSPATVNTSLYALRGVLKNAWRLGLMTADEYKRAADLQRIPDDTLPAGRELTPGELGALMAACESDASLNGARDAAIIALMYSAGLRRAEVTALDRSGYEADDCRMVIIGKRKKERAAFLVGGAADAMADWLAERGSFDGPLFVNLMYRKLSTERMTPQAIYNMLFKRGNQAGIKHFSPHDLRRTFVSDLLAAGADISTVARMAGHANVQTTMRYDRRPEEAKRIAANLLYIPYHRRRKLF